MKVPRYFSGLDLGSAQKFSAFTVVECVLADPWDHPQDRLSHYAVRYLERFPLGTASTIARELARWYEKAPLLQTALAVDLTAVGRPVLRAFQQAKIQGNRSRPPTLIEPH